MGLFKPAWMKERFSERAIIQISRITDITKLEEIRKAAPNPLIRDFTVKMLSLRSSNTTRRPVPVLHPCPKCGNELVGVEYYSAIKGDSSIVGQKSEWTARGHETTTITSTTYTDIQVHTGQCCLYCINQKAYAVLIASRILFVLGLLLIPCTLLFLMDLKYSAILVLLGVIAVVIGWKFMTNTKYTNSYRIGKNYIQRTTAMVHANEPEHDIASDNYIYWFPRKNIPAGRVLLSRALVKEMRGNKNHFGG